MEIKGAGHSISFLTEGEDILFLKVPYRFLISVEGVGGSD